MSARRVLRFEIGHPGDELRFVQLSFQRDCRCFGTVLVDLPRTQHVVADAFDDGVNVFFDLHVREVVQLDLLVLDDILFRLVAVVFLLRHERLQEHSRDMCAWLPETAGGSENASQRVVVLGQDRIELVVVAASASDGQA